MVDIMGALATASQAIKLVQDLRGIDKAIDSADYKLKIAELTSALADIKLALSDAKEELASKDNEIIALKRQFIRVSNTVEFHGFKYDKTNEGGPKGWPYCPVCEQKLGLMFHLAQIGTHQHCPHCKGDFGRPHIFGNE